MYMSSERQTFAGIYVQMEWRRV